MCLSFALPSASLIKIFVKFIRTVSILKQHGFGRNFHLCMEFRVLDATPVHRVEILHRVDMYIGVLVLGCEVDS